LADGWVCLSEILPLADAVAKREEDCRFVLLIDPADEIALANYERAILPINRPRFRDTACNGE
jgi:hypothetical protein